MTIPQAQKFVGQWKRILIPWHARTEAEAVRDMERSCLGAIGGMGLIITCTPTLPSFMKVAVPVFALLVGCMAFWLNLRFRQISRFFDSAGPQSFNDLKSDKFEK